MGKENPGNAVNLLCEGTVIVGDIKTKNDISQLLFIEKMKEMPNFFRMRVQKQFLNLIFDLFMVARLHELTQNRLPIILFMRYRHTLRQKEYLKVKSRTLFI